MKVAKSCDQVNSQFATNFIVGELYRIQSSQGTALVLCIGSGGSGYVVDLGTSGYQYGSLMLNAAAKPVHLPNAVIVTNEK